MPPVRVEAEQALQVTALEDPDEHAVGGSDRQQVEHDRLDRDHDRAERHQEQQEREPEHEDEHERRVRANRRDEVGVSRRLARDGVVGRHAALRAPPGPRPAAGSSSAPTGPRVLARPDERDLDLRDRVIAVDDRADRLAHDAGGERTSTKVGECSPRLRGRDVVRADDHDRRARRAGECALDVVVRLHDRQARRHVAEPDHRQMHAECGQGEHDEQCHRPDCGDDRVPQRRAQHRAPDARLLAVALQALQQRTPILQVPKQPRLPAEHAHEPCGQHRQHAAVDPVTELAEQRREHGQRADHRHEHDDHRAERERRVDPRNRPGACRPSRSAP